MHEHLVRSGLPPPVDSVDSPACLPPIAVILALGQAGRSIDVSMFMNFEHLRIFRIFMNLRVLACSPRLILSNIK